MQRNTRAVKTSSFHLILTVDKDFGDFVTSLSNKITRLGNSEFILDKKNYRPHITLYLFSAPIRNIKKIAEKVRDLSQEITETALKVDKLVLSKDGWIMLDMQIGDELLRYHKMSIRLINPLREGALRKKYKNKSYFEKLDSDEKKTLLDYGDKHSMAFFHPHLSLAKFKDQLVVEKAYLKYKDAKLPKVAKIVSLELVRTVGNESGGVGKILFEKRL